MLGVLLILNLTQKGRSIKHSWFIVTTPRLKKHQVSFTFASKHHGKKHKQACDKYCSSVQTKEPLQQTCAYNAPHANA